MTDGTLARGCLMKWYQTAAAGVLVFTVYLAGAAPAYAQDERSKRGSRLRNFLEQRRARRAAAPTTGPSAGHAAGTASTPGDYEGSLTVDGRARTYGLHIPSGFTTQQPYPLLLHFHGGGGSGRHAARKTGWIEYADREGFIAVFPDGVEHTWNAGKGATKAERLGVDDVGFISALIDHLTATLPIDPRRIYASGMSNGASLAHRLGCELSSKLAAIASVASEMAEHIAPTCHPSSPVSVIGIHGVADPLAPFVGGEGKRGRLLSAQATSQRWALHNGCSPVPSKMQLPPTVNDGTSVEQWMYQGCQHGTDVVWHAVSGMGHAWPPQPAKAPGLAGKSSQNLDATKVIWEFFTQHSRE